MRNWVFDFKNVLRSCKILYYAIQGDDKMKVKVLSKGLIVIPAAIRRRLGIKIGDIVDIIEEKDGIKIVPVKEKAADLVGIFSKYAKGKGIPTDKRIEEITEREAVKRYKKSNT